MSFFEWIHDVDVAVLNGIHNIFSSAFFDAVMPFITSLGDNGFIWIIAAIAFLFFKKTRKMGIMIGVALLVGLILGNGVLKNLFARIRPFDIENALITDPLIGKPLDFSFPSGHTMASFEAATVMLTQDKRFGIPALVLAILIAFSRMYLYVHYPSDILGGIIFGVLFGLLGVAIVNKVYKKFDKSLN